MRLTNTETGNVLRLASVAASCAASLASSAAFASSSAAVAASVLACAWALAVCNCVSASASRAAAFSFTVSACLMASGVAGRGGRVDGLERPLGLLQLRVGAGLAGLCGPQRLGGRGGVGGLAGGDAPHLAGLALDNFRFGSLGGGDRPQDLQRVGRLVRERRMWLDRRVGQLDAGRIRLEEVRVIEFGKRDVVAHDHHPHADVGQIEQPLGEVDGQAHAAVRGRMAGQHAGVHGNAGPGDALHERHVAVFVEVGVVVRLLLHDAEYAGRRLVAGRSGRNRRLQEHPAAAVVDRDALRIEPDHRQQRPAAAFERHHVAAVLAGRRLTVIVVGSYCLYCLYEPP